MPNVVAVEWVEYYRALGVDTFRIYDDTAPWPPKGDGIRRLGTLLPNVSVESREWDDKTWGGTQKVAFSKCLKHFSTAAWIGFLDVDEYAVLGNGTRSLRELLLRQGGGGSPLN